MPARSDACDRTRTALLQRRIIEIRIRIGVQDFVRELRRNGRIDGDAPDRTIFNAAQQLNQAVHVHRLVNDVLHHFFHQWMVGNLDFSFDVFKARCNIREDGRQ